LYYDFNVQHLNTGQKMFMQNTTAPSAPSPAPAYEERVIVASVLMTVYVLGVVLGCFVLRGQNWSVWNSPPMIFFAGYVLHCTLRIIEFILYIMRDVDATVLFMSSISYQLGASLYVRVWQLQLVRVEGLEESGVTTVNFPLKPILTWFLLWVLALAFDEVFQRTITGYPPLSLPFMFNIIHYIVLAATYIQVGTSLVTALAARLGHSQAYEGHVRRVACILPLAFLVRAVISVLQVKYPDMQESALSPVPRIIYILSVEILPISLGVLSLLYAQVTPATTEWNGMEILNPGDSSPSFHSYNTLITANGYGGKNVYGS